LFPGAKSEISEMSYQSMLPHFYYIHCLNILTLYTDHNKRVQAMHEQNNISLSHTTHAGRGYTAVNAREHGASKADTKSLGHWSDGGAYHIYDRRLPMEAMVAAASFNGRRPESYFLARDMLG